MSVAYPQREVSDLATWPDMQENFPCERKDNPESTSRVSCGGANPAEWVVRRKPCCDEGSAVLLWCTSCKDRVLALLYTRCPGCFTSFEPPSTAYSSIEPLGLK